MTIAAVDAIMIVEVLIEVEEDIIKENGLIYGGEPSEGSKYLVLNCCCPHRNRWSTIQKNPIKIT